MTSWVLVRCHPSGVVVRTPSFRLVTTSSSGSLDILSPVVVDLPSGGASSLTIKVSLVGDRLNTTVPFLHRPDLEGPEVKDDRE